MRGVSPLGVRAGERARRGLRNGAGLGGVDGVKERARDYGSSGACRTGPRNKRRSAFALSRRQLPPSATVDARSSFSIMWSFEPVERNIGNDALARIGPTFTGDEFGFFWI